MTLVSVIMSEYNTSPNYFKRAVESIIDQTYRDFEFIIVFDGSFENEKYLKEINDSRITIIKNLRNIGLAKSLNKAIKISKGEYIVRMDTDDVSLPNRLEVLVNEISSSKNKEFDVIGSSIIEFDDEQLNKKRILDIEITKKELVKRIAPVHPSVIMRKEILNEIGGYKDYNRCEDFVLWADVLCSGGRIKIIPDVLLLYHIDINDMRKRKISKRKDEIFARFKFYRKLDAGFFDYFNIMKTVFSGILPIRIMWLYHKFRR